jgi:hypothetical protein
MLVGLFPFLALCLIAALSLALTVALLYNREINLFTRVSVMLLCLLVFAISLIGSIFSGVMTMEVNRLFQGGEIFIHSVILGSSNRGAISFSPRTTQEEIGQTICILQDVPKEQYKIVRHNHRVWWGLEYMVHFNNGRSIFVAIEIPEEQIGKFGKKSEYLLRVIEEPMNGVISFCWYGDGQNMENETGADTLGNTGIEASECN